MDVDIDIQHLRELLQFFGYDIFQHYGDDYNDRIQLKWTENELIKFLVEKVKDLEENISIQIIKKLRNWQFIVFSVLNIN